VSLKKILGNVLLIGLLQVGALSGVKMTPEDIEKIMNAMHRTQVVQIKKTEDDNDEIKPRLNDTRRLPP
jgi:hypothetical protein